MVRRRHGWQLPAHTFQVVAITVFFLLAVAFYVFLAPFLWFQFLEFTALALYSPLAFAVFLLYIRSSAIDPADLGVFQPQSKYSEKGSFSEGSAGVTLEDALRSPRLSPSRSSFVIPSDKKTGCKATYVEESGVIWQRKKIQILLAGFGSLLCGWVVKDDNCKDEFTLQRPLSEEEVLFCTLCNAEVVGSSLLLDWLKKSVNVDVLVCQLDQCFPCVHFGRQPFGMVRKFSKQCRSCDKCVDGFDHHCRWLNNCVGRKNYVTFVSLMATSLSLLVLEWGLGMAVLVRCFVDKRALERQIIEKLENGFSRGPFATVVAICTVVSLLASVPLGELFFFHLILIRKGITTYEYVVAMRVQNEQQGFSAEGDVPSFPTSPSSSTATGLSGSSSIGLPYNRGGWCTPPRVFVDYQDEVVPHLVAGQLPSTTDPDVGPLASRYSNQQKKGAIRISAWKLAKLNTDQAIRAATRARETSSTLRQLEPCEGGDGEGDHTSSPNLSIKSSIGRDHYNNNQRSRYKSTASVANVHHPPTYIINDDSSVQHEPVDMGHSSRRIGGSPCRTLSVPTSFSPLPAECRYGLSFTTRELRVLATRQEGSMGVIPHDIVDDSGSTDNVRAHHVTMLSHSSADFSRAWSGPAASSDGYEASSGESVDDGDFQCKKHVSSMERVLTDNIDSSLEGKKVALIANRLSGEHGLLTRGKVEGTSNPINDTRGNKYHWLDSSASPSSLSNGRPSHDHDPGKFSPSQTGASTDVSNSLKSSSLTRGNLIYSESSIFYGGPIEQIPIITKEERLALPPKPTISLKTGLANPTVAPELKPPVRVVSRSQSPVFNPRTVLPVSLSGSSQN